MPSFTSSFDRAPNTARLRKVAMAALLAALMLTGIEAWLRLMGGQTSFPLSTDRWVANLEEALSHDDPHTTVLLGASRIRSSFDSATFFGRFPDRPLFYLATSGESPLALITFLAEKTTFSGNVIVALSAPSLEAGQEHTQRFIVERFTKEWNLDKRLNHRIGDLVTGSLVVRQEYYSLANLSKSLADDDLPMVPYWRRHGANGESSYDFSRVPNPLQGAQRPLTQALVVDKEAWERNLDGLLRDVRTLHRRGATVALVRFPTSSVLRANERLTWPRTDYWDRMAKAEGAIALHFEDYESLRRFELPDMSHVDRVEKPRFTSALLDLLESNGMTWRAD